MNDDPPRLLSGQVSPQAKELLEAAQHDILNSAQEARLRAKFGLGALPTASSPPLSPQAVASAGASAPWFWVKWAAFAGGLGAAAMWALSTRPAGEGPAENLTEAGEVVIEVPTIPTEPSPPRAPAEQPQLPAAESAESPRSADDSVAQRNTKATQALDAKAVMLRNDSSLADELALLDRARKAVSEGRGSAALQPLLVYSQKFPRGALREEATVLRIEALVLSGDKEQARRTALLFLEQAPRSPHRARVGSLVNKLQ